MADCIEREAVLRIVRGFCHPANIGDEIAKLPAADVRPVVRGAWIGIDDFPHEDWECSVCGEQVCGNDSIPRDMHYCPNCGAEMEAEERAETES